MAGVLPHTIYTVRRCTLPTPAIYFSSSKSGSADYWYTGNINSVNNSNYVRFQASQANNSGIIRHTTEPVVAVHTFTGTTGAVHDNGGVGLAPAANTKNIDTNNLCIGALIVSTTASLALDGDIGDIIVFPTAHSDTTRRYVEQLIAAKYGWPCIQGLSGFTASNYLQNASTTSGIRGDNANGTWVDMLIRPDAVPSGTQYLHNTYVTLTGCTVSSSGASLTFTAGNSAIAAASPVQTIAATDVGKLMLFGGSAGPANLVRGFVNGAEVGAGTAMAGYTKNESMAFDVGVRSGASSASSYSLFGLAGGNVEQVAATQAARAAAIKAAGAFVATGGVAPTHAWALTSDAASFADLVGSDALTRTGTLARAQIIVTTWPW